MLDNLNKLARIDAVKIILSFTAIYLIWGTTYLAIRVAVETIPPFFMAGVRFLLAGALFFIALRFFRVPLPRRLEWRSAWIIAAFLLVGGNGLVTRSEQQVPSGVAALVVATVPLWMTLLDWLVFKGNRPGFKITGGLLLGFLGTGLLIGPELLVNAREIAWFYWIVLLSAPILWSIGSLYSRQARLPSSTFMAAAMEMVAGGVLLLIAGLVTGEMSRLDFTGITVNSLLAMVYLSLVGSIVVLSAYLWLLKTVSATKVATYTYVNPIIAVFLGWLVLGESITWRMIVAGFVILMAMVVMTTTKALKPKNDHQIGQTGQSRAPNDPTGKPVVKCNQRMVA